MEKFQLLDMNNDGVISIKEFDTDLAEEVEFEDAKIW